MTDPVDDFAAGLEAADGIQPVVETPVPQIPETALGRALTEQLRAKGLNAPDEWYDDTLVDNILGLQSEAMAAKQLREDNERYKAQVAEYVASQATAQTVAKTQPPEEKPDPYAEYQIYEADPECVRFCNRDTSGVFVPKNSLSATHVEAARELNKQEASERKMAQLAVRNPKLYAKIALADELAEIRRENDARYAKYDERITPLQEQLAESHREREISAFCQANQAKLYADAEHMTPVGNLTNRLYLSGKHTLQEALALAEESLGTQTPVATAAPTKTPSLSKVQQKPVKFIDTLSQQSRLPAESNRFEGPAKKRPSMASVLQEWDEDLAGRQN